MPTLSDNLTHAVILLAGVVALTLLALYGNADTGTVVAIIALAMGVTGGVAATARGAAQALAGPTGPTVAPDPAPPSVSAGGIREAIDAGHLLGP